MRAVWALGEGSVAEVSDELASRGGRRLAYTTVMTMLSRLHERGLLTRRKVGRGYVYRPVADEASLLVTLSDRAVDAVLARYGTAALRQFAERLADLDPDVRQQLTRAATAEAEP